MPGPVRALTSRVAALALGCAVAASACSSASGDSGEFGAPRATVGLAPLENSTSPIVTPITAGTTESDEATTVDSTEPATTAAPDTTAAPVTTAPHTTGSLGSIPVEPSVTTI